MLHIVEGRHQNELLSYFPFPEVETLPLGVERYDNDANQDMPGLAQWFVLDIQVENEAGSAFYWYPNELDGKTAAEALFPILALA